MKRFLKILGLVLLVLVLALASLVLWLTVREYKPEAVEQLEVSAAGETEALSPDKELKILSWNVGYAGLGAEKEKRLPALRHAAHQMLGKFYPRNSAFQRRAKHLCPVDDADAVGNDQVRLLHGLSRHVRRQF